MNPDDDRSLVVRDKLVDLELAINVAAVLALQLLLDHAEPENSRVLSFDIARVHRRLGEAIKLTQTLQQRMLPKGKYIKAILHWGPEYSGKTDAAIARAKEWGVEMNTHGDWSSYGLHLFNTESETDALEAAMVFREEGQGAIVVELKTSTPPVYVSAFDEVWRFPERSRS